jgi:hypothetical protein
LLIGWRIYLTEERTRMLDPEKLSQQGALMPTPEEATELNRWHRQAQFHQLLRCFKLAKRHKPKILGGHFSITSAMYLRVNGCDEEYEGYGSEDDDLGRRVYAAGGHSVAAITKIPVFHLYHSTRAANSWRQFSGSQRFMRKDLPVRCVYGLDNPLPQPQVMEDLVAL